MKRTTLHIEKLDERCCPSVSASMMNGTLDVIGQGPTQLSITEYAPKSFQVLDHGNLVGRFTNVSGGLTLNLGNQSDNVSINLEGNTLNGSLNAAMGNGQNSLVLSNGTVGGAANITGGVSSDNIVLGGNGSTAPHSFPALTVSGNTNLNAGLSGNDAATIEAGVTLKGNLSVLSANTFTMEAASKVVGNASIYGGFASNDITVAGTVGKALSVQAGNVPNTLTLANTAAVDSLFANLGGAADVLDIDGTISLAMTLKTGGGKNVMNVDANVGGAATFDLGNGDNTLKFSGSAAALDVEGHQGRDVVNLTQGSVVAGSADLNLGADNDELTLAGTIGAPNSKVSLLVNSGPGADAVTFASSLVLNGSATVNMGAGNDTFTLKTGAAFASATINGGAGVDTFFGNASLVTLHGFEVIK